MKKRLIRGWKSVVYTRYRPCTTIVDNHHGFSLHPNQDFVLSRSLCKGGYAGGRWALFITLPAAICGESDQPDWLPRRFSPTVSAFERANAETRSCPLLSFHEKRENFLGERFRETRKSRQIFKIPYYNFRKLQQRVPLLLAKFI